MLRGIRWLVVLASVAMLVACQKNNGADGNSSNQSGDSTSKDFTQVIAKVGDLEITQGYFDQRFAQLSEAERKAFSGKDWRKRFLEQIIDETVLYKKALDEHFDQIPEIQAQLDIVRRQVLRKAYADKIASEAVPDEELIKAYYEKNKQEFKTLDRMLVTHIMCREKSKIDAAYAKLQAGEHFDKVAMEYDEDPNSQPNKGLIGWINPTGFVLGVGMQEEFNKVAFSLGFKEYSKPVLINKRWHIIRAGQKSEGVIPSLEEARPRVIEKLRSVVARNDYKKALKDLREEYSVQRFGPFKVVAAESAEELYRRAAEVQDPQARIDYYDQIANNFPKSDLADEALFTAGFIYSEELLKLDFASQEFHRLLDNYPDSDYADDAKWMLQNLGKIGMGKNGDDSAQEIREKIKSRKGN